MYIFQLLHLLCSLHYLFLMFFNVSFVLLFYLNLYNNTFLFQLFFYCACLFCCLSFSFNFSCVSKKIVVSILFFNFILTCFFVYSLCIYCTEFTINFSVSQFPSELEFVY